MARYVVPLMLIRFALACLEQFGARCRAGARFASAIDHVRRVAPIVDEDKGIHRSSKREVGEMTPARRRPRTPNCSHPLRLAS